MSPTNWQCWHQMPVTHFKWWAQKLINLGSMERMSMRKENSDVLNYLKIILSIMTASVPVLYLIGYYYDQGCLTVYGVNADYFPRTMQDYLVNSFFVFTKFILQTLETTSEFRSLFFALSVALAVISFAIVFAIKREWNLKTYKNKITNWKYYTYLNVPVVVFGIATVAPYVIVCMLFLIVLIPFSAYYQGRSDGREAINNYNEYKENDGESSRETTTILGGDKVIAKGKFVAKNGATIAIYDGKVTKVFTLKDEIVSVAKEVMPLPSKNMNLP